MSVPPKDPLDYYPKPLARGNAASNGCMILSILLAGGVGCVCSVTIALMLGAHDYGSAALLIACPIALSTLLIYLRRRQRSPFYPAVAITVITVATFFLLMGLCATH